MMEACNNTNREAKSKAVNAVENIGRNGSTCHSVIGSKKPGRLNKRGSRGEGSFSKLYQMPGREMELPGNMLVFFYGKTRVPGVAGFVAAIACAVFIVNRPQPFCMRANSVGSFHHRCNTSAGYCQAINGQ